MIGKLKPGQFYLVSDGTILVADGDMERCDGIKQREHAISEACAHKKAAPGSQMCVVQCIGIAVEVPAHVEWKGERG